LGEKVKKSLAGTALLALCIVLSSCAPAASYTGVTTATVPASQTPQPAQIASQSATPSTGPSPAPTQTAEQGIRIPVIVYHHILPVPSNYIAISPARFEQQLKFLKSEGYTGITARQLSDALSGQTQLPKRPVLLTFDDGRERQIRYAVPLLRQYGFTATFSVYPSAIHDRAGTFMSRSDLKRLAEMGFDVESHTVTHASMLKSRNETLTHYERRLRTELEQSKQTIERLTGEPVVALAYPFGYYDSFSADALAALGYKLGFTVDDGMNVAGTTPPFFWHRITIFRKTSLRDWETLVDAGSLSVTNQSPAPAQAVTSASEVSCVIPPLGPGERLSVSIDEKPAACHAVASPGGVTVRVAGIRFSGGFHLATVRVDGPSGTRIAGWGFTNFTTR